ncbi:MAG: 4-hydroxybenzoate octaprenyltransferase [Thermoplasmata archaeon]
MKIRKYLHFIKIEHTIFDLPFAYAGMLLYGNLNLRIFLLLTVAATSARVAGMVINRIVDLPLDKLNPRTQRRELVTGEISIKGAWMIFLLSSILFIFSSYLLNLMALIFAPVLIFLFYLYPFTKRIKIISHLFLGFSIGLIVVGGYIGSSGIFPLSIPVWLFMASVSFWIAAFDIIYQNQDRDFDVDHGIKSIPVLYPDRVKNYVFIFYFISLFFLIVFYSFINIFYNVFAILIGFLYFYRIKYINIKDVNYLFMFDIPIPFIVLFSLIIKLLW